jgi:hypothetical protein
MTDFIGSGSPLSQSGFDVAINMNAIESASLWSVLSVETSGCGFLADRRPKILFERHIFSKLTNGIYDAANPDVSNPTPGGYGDEGAPQYDRLQAALQLDETAALESASWGLGQIMGENYAAAGFADVSTMVTAMVGSEDAQLKAMAAFIKSNNMSSALQNHDWATFALHYNGANYAENNYDGKLQNFYAQYSTGTTPDLTVRAVQIYLTYKGFAVGGIDGIAGTHTTDAIKAFQTSIGVAATGVIDITLLTALTD